MLVKKKTIERPIIKRTLIERSANEKTVVEQPLKFALAICKCQCFCQEKSVFSLICIDKVLLKQNIYVNFWINYCKK